MIFNLNSLRNENIVLIADRTFKGYEKIVETDDNLEMIPDEYYFQVYDGLSAISKSVSHYNSLHSFINSIQNHKDSIVFTIYGGKRSRNRMALVPGICEAYNIRYVGADVYARIVCQDKQISKELSKRMGINIPEYVLIERHTDLEMIRSLALPIVVKPNMEGSSIGIHEDSLLDNYNTAMTKAYNIMEEFDQPVLVEEFVQGKEVCVCVSGTTNNIQIMEGIEVYSPDKEDHFVKKLYTAYDKHITNLPILHRPIFINEIDINKLHKVFLSLGKMDYMRIDGRVTDGNFTLIELTPDSHLGTNSSFACAFQKHGLGYTDMLTIMINNALTYYQNQYSSV